MNQAIGLLEVKGLASAVTIADTMLKVAAVELLGVEKARGFGWMTVEISGDVAAVQAAVDAGKAKAVDNQSFVSALVIPRPANNLDTVFFKKGKADDAAETKPAPQATLTEDSAPSIDEVKAADPIDEPVKSEPKDQQVIKEAPAAKAEPKAAPERPSKNKETKPVSDAAVKKAAGRKKKQGNQGGKDNE